MKASSRLFSWNYDVNYEFQGLHVLFYLLWKWCSVEAIQCFGSVYLAHSKRVSNYSYLTPKYTYNENWKRLLNIFNNYLQKLRGFIRKLNLYYLKYIQAVKQQRRIRLIYKPPFRSYQWWIVRSRWCKHFGLCIRQH